MSDWVVRMRADTLQPGTRFVFTEEMGGEGEVVTVESIVVNFGLALITTEELDFEIGWLPNRMMEVRTD